MKLPTLKTTLICVVPVLAALFVVLIWTKNSENTPPLSAADPTGKLPLIDYIHQQNLPCLQCHQLTTGSYGPGFKVVARQYRDKPDATNTLANHIVNGYGFMPSGLASQAQAEVLADKIMKLDR